MIRWLTFAALVDWLITRTLTRLGIFIPKTPAVITLYQGTSQVGQIASSFAGLLAIGTVLAIAWNEIQIQRRTWLPLVLLSLVALSIAFLFIPPIGWLALSAHLLTITGIALLITRMNGRMKIIALFPALVLILGELYQIGPVLYEVLRWPGPPSFGNLLFRLGEFFVLVSAFVWWWHFGRTAPRRTWGWALLPTLGFSGMILMASSMTSMLAIWSTGLTLYLPWPFYALAIWLISVAVIEAFKRDQSLFPAILLFAAGGYAPQLNSQVFFGLIALWLLKPSEENLIQSERALRVGVQGFNR